MRIAFFDDRSYVVYGAQENLLLLAAAVRDAHHEPTIYTSADGPFADAARSRGLDTIVIDAPERLQRFERTITPRTPLDAVRLTRDLVRYSAALHRRLRADRADVVVSGAIRPTLLLAITALRRRPRIVLWSQNSTRLGVAADVAALASWRIGLIGDRTTSAFGAPTRRLVRRRFRDLPSGREFDQYPVATHSQHPGDENLRDRHPITITTIASLTERKGIHTLFDAVARSGVAARVTVVGGTLGPASERYAAALREQAARLDLEVDFTGWQDDVRPHLAATDIFVLASTDEGLPGVLLEALATGLPCITTDAGNAGDPIRRCGAGVVVPIGDVRALADAITDLAAHPERRRELGALGAANVRTMYGLDAMRSAFDRILHEARS